MSILLESLSQKTAKEQGEVPDVHASHFDDDLLGDEWLIQRIKIWRAAAIVLLIALAASWFYFVNSMSALSDQATMNVDKPVQQNKTFPVSESEASTNTTIDSARSEIAASENSENVTEPAIAQPVEPKQSESVVAVEKQIYKPQKRASTTNTNTNLSPQSQSQIVPANSNVETGSVENSSDNNVALNLDELSESLRAEFPNIEINSFVVSENAEDSFVILDGSFYKINQVIAPQLVLREITKEAIVVEFKGQKVKLLNQ